MIQTIQTTVPIVNALLYKLFREVLKGNIYISLFVELLQILIPMILFLILNLSSNYHLYYVIQVV